MTDDRILLIRAGGTIDAAPYADPHNPPPFITPLKGADSKIHDTLTTLQNYDRVDEFTWLGAQEDRFVKDSQYYTQDDIDSLADIIKNDSHSYFILTHGTSDLAKNARKLQDALNGTDKTVVFVGAMVPLSMNAQHASDGIPSLQYAINRLHELPAGVHIVGRDAAQRLQFFDPATVEKDQDASRHHLTLTVTGR